MRLCWNSLGGLKIYDHDLRDKMEMVQHRRGKQVEGEDNICIGRKKRERKISEGEVKQFPRSGESSPFIVLKNNE